LNLSRVIDFLFSRYCLGCGREGDFICSFCRQRLPRRDLHPYHLTGQRFIDGIYSPFFFQGIIRRAIVELKYRNLKAVSATLANLLSECLKDNSLPGEILVPVPLHPKRVRQRGYNQSLLLCRDLGRIIDLPVAGNSLFRSCHTRQQVDLSKEERRLNVAGAFSLHGEELKEKEVLLVDDVSTTGATLDSCAKVLKAGGSRKVWGLTIAQEEHETG